jgi:uncharacterized membrane protein
MIQGPYILMVLNPYITEWINLFLRWFHVFAAILWIGSTYFFTWLDGRLTEEQAEAKDGSPAQVWMVHSGGFYIVEKQKTAVLLPRRLHWFKWEAAFTWLSGFLLMGLVYYKGSLLVDPDVRELTHGTAVAIGLGTLIGGWIVYDVLAQTSLVKYQFAFAAVCYVLLVAVIYALTHTLSARAAYIHAGAMMGTIMAANVWMRILPAQRRTIAAAKEGREPDARLAEGAKLRSKHNSFMVIPVLFTMISNHYPATTYGERNNWIILSILVLVGWAAAKIVRRA